MEPKVRQMIVCEDVRARTDSPGKLDVFGVMNRVTARHFPSNHSFAVYLCLTDGRGTGRGRIVVKQAVEEDPIYVGDLHTFRFGGSPAIAVSIHDSRLFMYAADTGTVHSRIRV